MINKEEIIKNIKKYRLDNNLTQEDLADELGYSIKSIAKWEQGLAIPPIEVLVELSAKTNISINKILGMDNTVQIDNVICDELIKKNKLNNRNTNSKDIYIDAIYTIYFKFSIILFQNNSNPFDKFVYEPKIKLEKDIIEILKNQKFLIEDNNYYTCSKELIFEIFKYRKNLTLKEINELKNEIKNLEDNSNIDDDSNINDVFLQHTKEELNYNNEFYKKLLDIQNKYNF